MIQVNLPSFAKPPVVETILGIQFDSIPGFTNNHLGLFWARLGGRTNWPLSTDAPALPPEFEKFEEEMQWSQADTLRFGFSPIPFNRMQLRNRNADRMLQVQNGRLIYNWLGSNGAEYARYEQIRPEFNAHIDLFRQFLSEEELPQIRANQWEVTYINHLPRGTVWNSVDDWSKVFKFQAVPPSELNQCRLETIGSQWTYEIPPRRGRLRIKLQHARSSNDKEILQLTLTARGPLGETEESLDTHEAGLDLGHEVVVKGFRELSSQPARDFWEERP
jgi:uncharacterized protein (TIGR04255 family)